MKVVLLFIFLSFTFSLTTTKDVEPPKVFWKYNEKKLDTDVQPKKDSLALPNFFQKLYESINFDSKSYGAYNRNNPIVWKNSPDSSIIKTVQYLADKKQLKKKSHLLKLSSRPKISHGPRRKRSQQTSLTNNFEKILDIKKSLLNIPLFCWKVLINCRKYRNHVCCPVMPNFMKHPNDRHRKKRSPPPSYVDPLFGIPLANPPQSETEVIPLKRSWKPYCKDNCDEVIDCEIDPDHEYCLGNNIDRFMTVGPFVQPTLIENWVSSLFELFGNDPITFVLAKQAIAIIFITIGMVIWGLIGNNFLELFQQFEESSKKTRADGQKDIDDLTSRILFAIEGNDWITKLQSKLENETQGNINRFICCIISNNKDSDIKLNHFECYGQKGTISQQKPMKCVSDLIYDFTLNRPKEKPKESRPSIDILE